MVQSIQQSFLVTQLINHRFSKIGSVLRIPAGNRAAPYRALTVLPGTLGAAGREEKGERKERVEGRGVEAREKVNLREGRGRGESLEEDKKRGSRLPPPPSPNTGYTSKQTRSQIKIYMSLLKFVGFRSSPVLLSSPEVLQAWLH